MRISDIEEFPHLKPELIILSVSKALNIPVDVIKGESRLEAVKEARFICIGIIMVIHPKITLTEVGNLFGGKHHTTIMNAKSKFEYWLGSDYGFTNKVIKVRNFIN